MLCRIIGPAALALLALPAGTALAAGAIETELLGRDPGTAAAYSCFSRHYDAAHLAAHPKQNVRDMQAFVESTYDPDNGRSNSLQIGVMFRGLDKPIDISGSCDAGVDGQKILSCGADCDGGHFDVSTQGKDSILVSIPDSVSMWDPSASEEEERPDLPKAAALGQDDKLFRLDRVDVKQCRSIMSQDAEAAIFGTTTAAAK